MAVLAIFGIRLFYVQVIQYDHFKKAALGDQLKQYEISAERGVIKAYDGSKVVPIVLNQKLYTLFVDPSLVKHPDKYASAVSSVVGGQPGDYLRLLQAKNTRYVILKKQLTQAQSDKIRKLEYAGLGTEVVPSRTYPQGSLAAQVLGFVNDEGVSASALRAATLDASTTPTCASVSSSVRVSGSPRSSPSPLSQPTPRLMVPW
jgi:cell division protein FtsI/penicillin-binding protein 2